MPDNTPESTYPFANNCLVVASQVWILTTGDMFTYNGRLVSGFTGVAVILFALPGLTLLPSPLNYWVIFGILILYGAFSGVAQGSVYTMAANLPFKYMGAVMFGNGLSGIACNVLRAITLAAFPVDPNDPDTDSNSFYGAVVFLWIGTLMVVGCVVMQACYLRTNPYYVYYLDWIVAAKDRENNLDADQETFDYGLANTNLTLVQ